MRLQKEHILRKSHLGPRSMQACYVILHPVYWRWSELRWDTHNYKVLYTWLYRSRVLIVSILFLCECCWLVARTVVLSQTLFSGCMGGTQHSGCCFYLSVIYQQEKTILQQGVSRYWLRRSVCIEQLQQKIDKMVEQLSYQPGDSRLWQPDIEWRLLDQWLKTTTCLCEGFSGIPVAFWCTATNAWDSLCRSLAN